jgi:hypothetical protein
MKRSTKIEGRISAQLLGLLLWSHVTHSPPGDRRRAHQGTHSHDVIPTLFISILGLHANVSSVNIQLTKRANNENKHMNDRKAYMRDYMRRKRASIANKKDANSANMQFTEQLREVIRQEIEEAIQLLLVQLTKLTVNSASNGIPPVQEPTAAAAQTSAKLPPKRIPALIRQAKNLHTQGLSWGEIAKQWNAKGVPTFTGIGQWHGATVAKLVRNE